MTDTSKEQKIIEECLMNLYDEMTERFSKIQERLDDYSAQYDTDLEDKDEQR